MGNSYEAHQNPMSTLRTETEILPMGNFMQIFWLFVFLSSTSKNGTFLFALLHILKPKFICLGDYMT